LSVETPPTLKVELSVVPPVTPNPPAAIFTLEAKLAAPVTANVEESVAAPAIPTVEEKVAAPVTPIPPDVTCNAAL